MDRKEAAERIQEVMATIRTQHMCKDIDGECTEEDRKAYIQRFEACKVAIAALQEPERMKGRWVDGDCRCPICGEDKFKDLDADIWADWKPPFCPNCGADMRGEEE